VLIVVTQGKIDGKACALIANASIPAYKNDKIGPSKLLMVRRVQFPTIWQRH
jgi:hypothetical protein